MKEFIKCQDEIGWKDGLPVFIKRLAGEIMKLILDEHTIF